MADDMEKKPQQGNQPGQSGQQDQSGQKGQGQPGQGGHQSGQTDQQKKGTAFPDQNKDKENPDQQRRAS